MRPVSTADDRSLLDTTIRATTHTAGPWATYVDPTTFAGHGLCTDSPWLNPVQASITFDGSGRATAVQPSPGSLHPTAEGQESGYENAFTAAGLTTT